MATVNTWDDTKRRRNLKDHGVDFADLEEYFSGDLLTREDLRSAYEEHRDQDIGTLYGVSLLVVDAARREWRYSPHHFSQKGGKS